MSKHSNTQWGILETEGMRWIDNGVYETFGAYFPNGTVLKSNCIHYVRKADQPLPKPFLIDQKDEELLRTQVMNRHDACKLLNRHLFSLANFQLFYPEKQIYLRYFFNYHEPDNKRVFTDDVLAILPLVLRQQKTPIVRSDVRYARLERDWDECAPKYNTINLDKLKETLELFDIDKSLIILAPELDLEVAKINMLCRSTCNKFFISPHSERVMTRNQAILYIFQNLVCGVNWEREDTCTVHPNCKEYKRKTVMSYMKKYAGLDPGIVVTIDDITKFSNILYTCQTVYGSRNKKKYDFTLDDRDSDSLIDIEHYRFVCEHFGLKFSQTKELRVDFARIFLMIGFFESFFKESEPQLQRVIANELLNFITPDVREGMKDHLSDHFPFAFPKPGSQESMEWESNKPTPDTSFAAYVERAKQLKPGNKS